MAIKFCFPKGSRGLARHSAATMSLAIKDDREESRHVVLNKAKGEVEGTLFVDTLHRRSALRLDGHDVDNERCVLQDGVGIGADRLTRTP